MKFISLIAILMIGPAHGTLIGISTQSDALYEISEETGLAVKLFQTGGNFAGIGLSFIGNRLFATDNMIHIGEPWDFRLAEIGLADQSLVNVNGQGGSLNWHGLASNQDTQFLYAIDINDHFTLKEISLDGSIRSIGTGTGIDGRGMDFDDTHGILYATHMDTRSLYTVDILTGTSTLIGYMGIDAELIGLAYDERSGTLFANTTLNASREGFYESSLFRLNTHTGEATLVGFNQANRIDGLAWIDSPNAVPEPGTIAYFATGLLILAFVARKRMKFVAAGILLAATHPVQAEMISADLFKSELPTIQFGMDPGQTFYLFIKANEDLILKSIDIEGTPISYLNHVSDFRWQVFKTTSDWDTPNGNGDRLFYIQDFFDDQVTASYSTPMSVELEAGGYYRLSFQIANMNWMQTYHFDWDQTGTYGTNDGSLEVFGHSGASVAPSIRKVPLVTLQLESTSPVVPEPATSILLLAGLAGMFYLKRGTLLKG